MSGHIRNIQQSVQDRDVVKQAPDIVVYIDGQNYLINPYLGTGAPGVAVPFNDYVTGFQASYDVESLVPTGSVSLVVPNAADYQFRTPGGNNLFQTMSEIRIFAKGYYLSPRGNTVYRQVFRGFISSVNYTMDGKHTTINIACFGAMGLLERMQVDMTPANQSNAAQESLPMTSTAWNLSPVDQIAWVFLYRSMLDGFNVVSVQQATLDPSSPYYQAIQDNFVVKWQALLFDLARDVHLFGKPNVTNVINSMNQGSRYPDTSSTPYSKGVMATRNDRIGTLSESEVQAQDQGYYDQLRGYMPDMSFGSIQLLNGNIMNRLERLRYIVSLIGFEAYQDIDGGVIFKPPLYNLDVTNVNQPDVAALDNSLIDIYEQNNPFVVQLSEILDESENEDEGAVRVTRAMVRGSIDPSIQTVSGDGWIPVAEEYDIPKLAQFGLRTEAPHTVAWFTSGDSKALHAYAALDMARANRAFRTYSITIPMRAELKLGFPMYLPHRDLYGYIKSVTLNYTQGSNATMGILLDSLRRRPMFPEQQKVPSADGTTSHVTTLLTPQKNLVLQWTSAPATVTPTPAAQLTGQMASMTIPQQMIFDQEIQMTHYREKVIANSYSPNPDTSSHAWRVQPDTDGVFTTQRKVEAAPSGTTSTPQNDYYEALRNTRPYTDDKGYELIGPFPLGRWDSLKNSLYNFTVQNSLQQAAASSSAATPLTASSTVSAATSTLNSSAAFLFTGAGTPTSTPEAATQLLTSLEAQSVRIGNFKVFELTYDTTNTPSNIGGIQSVTDPGSIVEAGLIDTASNLTARVQTFLTGSKPQPSSATSALASAAATRTADTGQPATTVQQVAVHPTT